MSIVAKVADQQQIALEDALQEIAKAMPIALGSETVGVCIAVNKQEFASSSFHRSEANLSANIGLSDGVIGAITVSKSQTDGESEFSEDDRILLQLVADRIAGMMEKRKIRRQFRKMSHQLKVKHRAFRRANTALKEVLAQIESERRNVNRSVTMNVRKVIGPLLGELETQVPPAQRVLITVLRQRLDEITSPFTDQLSQKFTSLSSVEISICHMIRDNLSTKEIASLRRVSPATVSRQRESIRRKLGIASSNVNLATYLRTFMQS
jgi:DNA-binding CsgD family transcriptional regulator